MAGWVRPLAVVGVCAYPLLNHTAAVSGEPRWAALAVALVVCGLAAGWLGGIATVLLTTAALVLSLWLAGRFPGLLLYTPPIVINLVLCVFFARTLLPGREPLVRRFARIERGGQLAPDLARYTRNLTWSWAGFFALMAAISATLAVTGPLAAWSLFTNILNYLLVALFFMLEYLYRRIRYRHHPHASPWQLICRLRNYRVVPRPPGEALK
ncbi:MAG TPA: hypothetical protein VKF40_19865 [Burkholderiales bacterium]|nr:hypothetical protein [Burkholderiales bacterium]